MKYLFALICLLFFSLFFSCQTRRVGELPVDKAQLVPLLVDLQLAESLAIEVPVQVRDSMQAVYIEKVLQDHQVNQNQLDSLMWIVRSEPSWIVEVFTAVSDSLAIRKASGPAQKEVLEPKAD